MIWNRKAKEEAIERNLKRVENGKALDMPLAVLDGELKKRWFGDSDYQKERNKEWGREYYQRPEIKKKQREYMREYRQQPKVKQKIKKHNREYNQRKKLRNSKGVT